MCWYCDAMTVRLLFSALFFVLRNCFFDHLRWLSKSSELRTSQLGKRRAVVKRYGKVTQARHFFFWEERPDLGGPISLHVDF